MCGGDYFCSNSKCPSNFIFSKRNIKYACNSIVRGVAYATPAILGIGLGLIFSLSLLDSGYNIGYADGYKKGHSSAMTTIQTTSISA